MFKSVVKRKKVSKKKLDSLIKEIINLKDKQAQLKQILNEKIIYIEGMYRKSVDIEETLSGIEYEARKVIIDKGKNIYNSLIIKSYLDKINDPEITKNVIIIKEEVNSKKLNELVSAGYLTSEQLDAAREHKYTFSTSFRKKQLISLPQEKLLNTKAIIQNTTILSSTLNNSSKEDISEKDASEKDASEKDASEKDIFEKNVSKKNVSKENVLKEDSLEKKFLVDNLLENNSSSIFDNAPLLKKLSRKSSSQKSSSSKSLPQKNI